MVKDLERWQNDEIPADKLALLENKTSTDTVKYYEINERATIRVEKLGDDSFNVLVKRPMMVISYTGTLEDVKNRHTNITSKVSADFGG